MFDPVDSNRLIAEVENALRPYYAQIYSEVHVDANSATLVVTVRNGSDDLTVKVTDVDKGGVSIGRILNVLEEIKLEVEEEKQKAELDRLIESALIDD